MREFKDRKGVKSFHLFNETWRVGRFIEKKDAPSHVVIYGPDDKEYHVYGDEAKSLTSYSEERGDTFIEKTKVKIYILTSILDERKNWCFNMEKTPKLPGQVKVIFEDATIRWIASFSGDWKNHRKEIPTKIPVGLNPEWEGNMFGKKKKGIEPSQHIWEPAIDYKNIIAWRKI